MDFLELLQVVLRFVLDWRSILIVIILMRGWLSLRMTVMTRFLTFLFLFLFLFFLFLP